MLVVHHLGVSQSERIIWTCEELRLPYTLKRYDRDPVTRAAPTEYKRLHFYGTAPVIQDGDLTLGESGAIVEYLCRKHGNGQLTVGPSSANFAQYLYWFHFANATFLPAGTMATSAAPAMLDAAKWERVRRLRFNRAFDMVETRLGEVPYFAGLEFTAADIMMVLPLTKTRMNNPHDLSGSPNTLAYLQRIGARPAFQRACQKGDPELPLYLT